MNEVYVSEDMSADNIKDKESKMIFLQKCIDILGQYKCEDVKGKEEKGEGERALHRASSFGSSLFSLFFFHLFPPSI